MKRYVKLADEPTFYLIDADGPPRAIHGPDEMHEIGLLPVAFVTEDELQALLSVAPPRPDREQEE